jgi:hypothetical protein
VTNFLIAILGDVTSAIIIAIVPLSIIMARTNRRQRQIAAFFGLTPSVRTLHVLLSRYRPEREIERLADGAPSSGYVGETVAVDEFIGAQALRDLFDSKWIIASFASIIGGSISGKRDFGRIDVTISPVTDPANRPTTGTVVLMGTGAKESNWLAAELLGVDAENSVFEFVKDGDGRAFRRLAVRGYSTEIYHAADYDSHELAVLQRATMKDGRVIFLCAGKDVAGSRRAAEFLSANWKSLHEEFGGRNNGDFARLYAFSRSSADSIILTSLS